MSVLPALLFLLIYAPSAHATIGANTDDLLLGQTAVSTSAANAGYGLAPLGDTSVAIDTTTGEVYLSDTNNNRILFWTAGAWSSGASPTGVVGQTNLNSTGSGGGNSNLNAPHGIFVDGNENLWVADTGNGRVLKFPAPISTGESATVVLSATLSSPEGVAISTAGVLWVADTGNDRVAGYAAGFVNGASPTITEGVTGTPGDTSNEMDMPQDVSFDGSGNLWVTDTGNNRIVEFDASSITVSGANGDIVIGQAGYGTNGSGTTATTLSAPRSAVVDVSGNLWVADAGNNRIMEFPVVNSNGEAASQVLGQSVFTSSGTGDAASQSYGAAGVAVDAASPADLWVADTVNDRAMEFSESDISHGSGASSSLVYTGVSASGLQSAFDVTSDTNTGRVYVADTANNRVLWWNSEVALSTGAPANGVLGQPDLTSAGPGSSQTQLSAPQGVYADGAGNVWVADTGNNRVLEFPPPSGNGENASWVLGQSGFGPNGAATTQTGLSSPAGVYLDGNFNVWVADTGNNRVLGYYFPITAYGQSASIALGQSGFGAGGSGSGNGSMNRPKGVVRDLNNTVWVADSANNRVLGFTGLTTGESASIVLAGNSGDSASEMSDPAGLAVDTLGDLWVADAGNNRVVGFSAPIANGNGANLLLGQTAFNGNAAGNGAGGMSSPHGVGLDIAANLWVADAGNNRAMEFQAMPETTTFTVAEVGISTITVSWPNVAAQRYRVDMAVNAGCNFNAAQASSNTYNTYAIFGTTQTLSANTVYCFRVTGSDANNDALGTFSAVASTATFATLTTGVSAVVPTENAPISPPDYVHNNTFIFQGSTANAASPAQVYLSTWNQTGTYQFKGSEPQFGGVDLATYTATVEGLWYHQVSAENVLGVFNTTNTVLAYDYDITAPTASVTSFASVNSFGTSLATGSWNNLISGPTMYVSVQDVAGTGGSNPSGLNAVGYSSGTSAANLGLWHFDEPSGLRAFNFGSAGHNVDGILSSIGGTPPARVPGRFGYALQFSPAQNNFVNCGTEGTDTLSLNQGNASNLGLEAWVEPAAANTGSNQFIISRWSDLGTDTAYALYLTNNSQSPSSFSYPAFGFLDNSGSNQQLASPVSIAVGAWSQVAAVFDGNGAVSGTPAAYLYINGVMTASMTLTANDLIKGNPAIPTLIGAGFHGGNGDPEETNVTSVDNVFDGTIDEPRIYSNAVAGLGEQALRVSDVDSDYGSGYGWTPYVMVSSDAGNDWQLSQSSVSGSVQYSLPQAQGNTAAATFQLSGATLATSTSCATGSHATNQAVFVLTDQAGNEMVAGPYGILDDTAPPVGSTVTVVSSSQGVTGTIMALSTNSWSALASGLTVQFTLQDSISGLDETPGQFSAEYTTNGGMTWNLVNNTTPGSGPYVGISGVQGSTQTQTLSLYNVNLIQSDPDSGLNNEVVFISSDQARNQLVTAGYVVYVDSTPPIAVSTVTALTPYASGQIQLSWDSTGGSGDSNNFYGNYDVMYTTVPAIAQTSSDWNPANPVTYQSEVQIATAAVAPGTTNTILLSNLLNDDTNYYFRVFEKDRAGNYSPLSAGATIATLAHPSVPNGLMDTVLGVSSVSWTWNQTASSQTSTYNVFGYYDSSGLLVSLSTPTNSYTRVALATNTVYGVQVQAVNPANPSGLSLGDTDYTLAAQPGVAVISSVSYSSVTFTWASDGNPSYTDYEVSQSTDDFVTSVMVAVPFSAVWTQTTTTALNLSPGTSYYFRERAENKQNDDPSAYVTLYSTPMLTQSLPIPPTNLAGAAQGTSSITWTWNGIGNGGATLYRVPSATAPAGDYLTTALPVSVTTFIETGLSTNTIYAVQAEAYVPSGSGGLTPAVTVYTLAAVPGQPQFVSATTSTLSVSWDPQGNPGYTPYEASLTTDPNFITGISTPVAFSADWTTPATTFVNLAPGTSYFYRVRAENNDPNVISTTALSASNLAPTVPVPVSGLAISTVAISSTSLQWSWSPQGNGDATSYQLNIQFSEVASTADLNTENLSTYVGAPQISTFTLPASQFPVANAYFLLQVTPQTASGAAAPTSYIGGYGLANPPTNVQIAQDAPTSVTLTWNANANSPWTRYQVTYSTDQFVSNFNTAVSYLDNMTLTTFTVTGLVEATTYYFDVSAINNVTPNVTIGPDVAETAIPPFGSFMISTFTEDSAPMSVAGYALGTSSISWSWNNIVNTQQYNVYAASSDVVLVSTPLATPASPSFVETGLSTNTAYSIQVNAENFNNEGAGGGPLSAPTTRYTAAAVPGTPVFQPVSTMTVVLSWDPQDNPSYTNYEVSDSTDGFVNNFSTPIVFASSFTFTTATISGLMSATTYTFRVRAENGYDKATAFDTYASTRTLGIPGTITTLTGNSFFPGEIDLTWTQPGENGSSGTITSGIYDVVYSSVSPTLLTSTVPSSGLYDFQISSTIVPGVSFSTSVEGLAYSDTYYISVFTQNTEGVLSAESNVFTRLSPPVIKAFTIDVSSFCFFGSSITPGSSIVTSTPTILVSTGNVAISYALVANLVNSTWTLEPSNQSFETPPENVIQLFGAFDPVAPSTAAFIQTSYNDLITSTPTVARTPGAGSTFSLQTQDEPGNDIPPAINPCAQVYDPTISTNTCQTSYLWFEMNLPPYTTTQSTQTIQITISAQ